MSERSEIHYTELTRDMITPQIVHDLNKLLPQLTATASPVSKSLLRDLLFSGSRLFMAMSDDHVVGTIVLCRTVTLTGFKDWIEDVIVDTNHQRRGIGDHLMDMAEDASRQDDGRSINLTSSPHRGNARKMYGRRGYELRETDVFRKLL